MPVAFGKLQAGTARKLATGFLVVTGGLLICRALFASSAASTTPIYTGKRLTATNTSVSTTAATASTPGTSPVEERVLRFIPERSDLHLSSARRPGKGSFVSSPFNYDNWQRNLTVLEAFGVNSLRCHIPWLKKPAMKNSSSRSGPTQLQGSTSQTPRDGANAVNAAAKKLIVWQAFDTLPLTVDGSAVFERCPVNTCTLSSQPQHVPQADAVVFDDGAMVRQKPPVRRSDQIFIYHNMRPSAEVRLQYFFEAWRAAFNWTWSYRLDSDIFQPFAYLRKTQPAHSLSFYLNAAKKKSALAVYIKEHQGQSQSKLEAFSNHLEQEMSLNAIDVNDMNASVPGFKTWTDDKGLLKKYFFLLSFEKTLCEDFVTETFFDAFDPEIHALPVVRGAVDYKHLFPSSTFLDVSTVGGPKEVAKVLTRLAANKKAYAEMLWKKAHYEKVDGLPAAWCQLCEKLHGFHGDCHYDDMQTWWWGTGRCHPAKIF